MQHGFRRRRLMAAIGFSFALGGTSLAPAHADTWPTKPVTIVVAFAPGGMTDIVGRMLAAELSQTFKQSFVVENRPGAAGQLATEYVARKPNDGYTLLLSATGHVIGPAVQKTVRYRPVLDFEPIALIAKAPNMLVVNPSVPAHTVPEFVAWAKAQGSVPYGSAGVGGSTHLAGELFRHMTGAPLVHVPYKGASPSTSDAVAGQIPVVFQDSMSVSAFIAVGKLRPIAVTSLERSKLFPDVPTIAEAGYKNFDAYTWLGLYAPAGTPAAIVTRLNTEVNRIMSSPDMVAKLRKQNAEAAGNLNPVEFRKYVETEVAKWQNMVKITGVQIEQ
ncbi:tripartite tricarboxylate transporter substrate binding protein [Cupriavidus metallidurans]|uniref:tripartite tricarboxylate transporter substrate binding protein n=1 Tax=Cupriavidus TaxID=106589 RepID=UPI000E7E7D7E|nr:MULTISPECIES: tripartite tricarboxylate transporter substrate binding protein [unclassified Cupriavidus]GMG94261.1 MFS transporter [Cupriavidus sp. TKC]HBD39480.1 ABC transporter substrate-binding protein [Cupriavidus sp.]HBO83213.1 ABC transporter substrate-binding protein [Cupriavidus sp.]